MTATTTPTTAAPHTGMVPSGVGMKSSVALRKAHDMITPEGAWTQEAFARSERGWPIGPCTDNAICWCDVGAVRHVIKDFDWMSSESIYYLSKYINGNVVDFHEYSNHTEVLDAFDHAAALAESEGF